MLPACRRLAIALAVLATPAAAERAPDYLEACIAAAGGHTSEARTTCFGQLSEVCLAATAGTTTDMVTCAEIEFQAWTALHDESLATLRASEPPERVAMIDRAEDAWLAWRSARCEVFTSYDGSIGRPLAMLCLAQSTARRVDDLWAIERGLVGEAAR